MKLIREEIEQVEVIVESRNGKKNLFIESLISDGDSSAIIKFINSSMR